MRRVRAVLLVVLAAAAPALGAGREPVVTTDLLRLRALSDVAVAPDGRRAAFVVTTFAKTDKKGKDEHAYRRHLWLADLAAGTVRPLTHGERSDRDPQWSPDGTRLAFVRAADGKAQVFVLPLEGGEAFAVTTARHGAARPRWSPDGRTILFSASVPIHALEGAPAWDHERPGRRFGDEPNWAARKEREEKAAQGGPAPEKDEPPARPAGTLAEIRSWLARNASESDPKVLTRQDLQGENHLEPVLEFAHPHVVEAREGAEARALARGFRDYEGCEWTRDGHGVLCASFDPARHPDRALDRDLVRVEVASGAESVFLDLPGLRVESPRPSPDGRSVAFTASPLDDPSYGQQQVAVVAAGGEVRWLTRALDRDAGEPAWSADGRFLYFVAADRGAFPLFRVAAAGGPVTPVVGGPRGVRAFDVGRAGLVFALTEVASPFELYASALDGKGERRLGVFNADWTAAKALSVPQERWLNGPDGTRVQYWVMEPALRKEGVRYPLLVEMHGGPSAMWGPGEATMWHEFQLLASWGYGIVFANPRGSGGYGHAFQKANYRDWGTGPAGDVLAAADEAAKLPWVDAGQLVLTGGSYAGYLTAWIVGHDHRFKAAVAQRGVYELTTFFGEGNAWRLVPWHFGGYPWEDEARTVLLANSPQTFVANVTTPLLIVHSDRDLRTGVSQSELLYRSLKVLGRPVEYVRYPEEGHELSRSGNPRRRMDRLNRILEFFERFVTHPEPPPAAGVGPAAAR